MELNGGLPVILVLVLLTDLSQTLPTGKEPESNNSKSLVPPLVFPEDSSTYKIVPVNITALKEQRLQGAKITSQQNEIFGKDVEFTSAVAVASTNANSGDLNLKNQIENFQPDDVTRSQIELEERFHRQNLGNYKSVEDFPENIETLTDDLEKSKNFYFGIAAIAFVVMCGLIYFGLLYWRQRLEKRYYNRHRLITEECFYSDNDTRWH